MRREPFGPLSTSKKDSNGYTAAKYKPGCFVSAAPAHKTAPINKFFCLSVSDAPSFDINSMYTEAKAMQAIGVSAYPESIKSPLSQRSRAPVVLTERIRPRFL